MAVNTRKWFMVEADGDAVAKFKHKGNAYLYAKSLVEDPKWGRTKVALVKNPKGSVEYRLEKKED